MIDTKEKINRRQQGEQGKDTITMLLVPSLAGSWFLDSIQQPRPK